MLLRKTQGHQRERGKNAGGFQLLDPPQFDESGYDLRPFMRHIKASDYRGPIGFINFKPTSAPEDHLVRTLKRWQELCTEVGLFATGR
jgi:hypothetical protein